MEVDLEEIEEQEDEEILATLKAYLETNFRVECKLKAF